MCTTGLAKHWMVRAKTWDSEKSSEQNFEHNQMAQQQLADVSKNIDLHIQPLFTAFSRNFIKFWNIHVNHLTDTYS